MILYVATPRVWSVRRVQVNLKPRMYSMYARFSENEFPEVRLENDRWRMVTRACATTANFFMLGDLVSQWCQPCDQSNQPLPSDPSQPVRPSPGFSLFQHDAHATPRLLRRSTWRSVRRSSHPAAHPPSSASPLMTWHPGTWRVGRGLQGAGTQDRDQSPGRWSGDTQGHGRSPRRCRRGAWISLAWSRLGATTAWSYSRRAERRDLRHHTASARQRTVEVAEVVAVLWGHRCAAGCSAAKAAPPSAET